MSNSPLGEGGVPPDPVHKDLHEAFQEYQAAMYRMDDCLRRHRDNADLRDCAGIVWTYADRQLMLAGQEVEKARVALEVIRRIMCGDPPPPPTPDPFIPQRMRPLFPSEGPYEGGK